MRVSYSYLDRQFTELDGFFDDIQETVRRGDFTLGAAVSEFERRFAELCGVPYAVGVGCGTDALLLALKVLGIGTGHEVITAANTFIATIGAISLAGARPILVDNGADYTIDVDLLEGAITARTKAIVPVHLTGTIADMPVVREIAERHNLAVIEDAAQAILASRDGKNAGAWGDLGCFSLHPLKNLNIWGDGGVVVTRSAEYFEQLRLLRNHGLVNRDEAVIFGHNSRLDTIQAAVGSRLIGDVPSITDKRNENAGRYDRAFADLTDFVDIPPRHANVRQVFHTYIIRVKHRDKLLAYLKDHGVSAKVHYPVPVHLQPAARPLGYKLGDFPKCETDCGSIITLPVHQHLMDEEIEYVIDRVREFYGA